MNNNPYTDAFIKQMKDFLNKLSFICPNESIFEDALNNFKMASRIDSYKLVKQFHTYVKPYEEKIKSRDENFFLNTEYSQDDNFISNTSDHLKSVWRNSFLSLESRENIWKYFEILLLLSEKSLNNKK